MTEPTSLGRLLRRYRAAAALSQEALAERAGISARAVSDLERGLHHIPHAGTLDRLATALALTAAERAALLAAAHPELAADHGPPGVLAAPAPSWSWRTGASRWPRPTSGRLPPADARTMLPHGTAPRA